MHKQLLLGVLAAGALACVPQAVPSQLEANRGVAQSAIIARQIENPAAGETAKSVEGVSAATAAEIIANYHRNQQADNQEATQRNQRDNGVVDVSGGGGGGE